MICPLDNYDSDVTTKQNILCDGRSIRQVLKTSPDLILDEEETDGHPGNNNNNNTTPTMKKHVFRSPSFTYILPGPKLYVLVLDRSSSSSNTDLDLENDSRNWEVLQQALFQFIAKLPTGSSLSIISYGGEDAQMNLPPTLITEKNREGLHGRIPRRPLVHEYDSACLDCALKMAFKVMRTSSATGSDLAGTIVLATKSTAGTDISQENSDLIVNNAVPVYNVALKADSQHDVNGNLTKFGNRFVVDNNQDTSSSSSSSIPSSSSSTSNSYHETRRNNPRYLTKMSDVLTSILRSSTPEMNIMSFHKDQRVPNIDNVIGGNFVVEEHLRKNLWIIVTADDERDIESFEVLSPTGTKHSFPTFEHSLAYFNLQGLNEPGIWSYSIKLYQTLASHYPVYLEVLGEPNDANAITLDTWVSQSTSGDRAEIMLYAQLKQGSLPVLDGKVVATVTRPSGVASHPSGEGFQGSNRAGSGETVRVELRDMGTGYPDVTKGDGIYSAYFTDFAPVSGHYQISFSVSHNSGNARTPKLSATIDADENVCCGSAMPVSYTIPTGPFQRFAVGTSFYVEQASNFYIRQGSRLINDVFPPSRITDFKVNNYLDNSLFVTLKWTAPGGDYDQGKAFRYEIRCYTNKEALRDDNFSEMSIPVHATLIPEPEMNGVEQRCTVGVPWPNELFYYAIVAFDDSGNRGKISNTIAVFIKEEPATIAEDESELYNDIEIGSPLEEPLQHMSENSRQITYIVVGVVCGVLFVLIILVVVAIRRHHRFITRIMKDSESASHGSNSSTSTDSAGLNEDGSSLSETLKKIMAPLPDLTSQTTDKGRIWSPSSGGSSPTSDYSSQKSPLPSISGTIGWQYKNGLQKATSQELPGIHKIMSTEPPSMLSRNNTSERRHHGLPQPPLQQPAKSDCGTTNTDCSIYESSESSNGSHSNNGQQLLPRISVLEDYSVYRDLSNLSVKNDNYFSFSQLPAELQQANSSGHVITVPPYYDVNTLEAQRKRHESLV